MRMILAVLAIWVMLAGAAVAQSGRVVDVTMAGARPDDGTDDTTAIQKAINQAEAEAGATGNRVVVFFPRGTYHISTLTIDAPNVTLSGYDAKIDLITHGGNANQMLWLKGPVDSGTAENIIIRGLTFDGNYPTVNNSGDGIGLNIRCNHVYVRDVTVTNTEDDTYVSNSCLDTKFSNCISREAGLNGFRIVGDEQVVKDCEVYNWNVQNVGNGPRALFCDSNAIDAETLTVENFYVELTSRNLGSTAILVDCGDGTVTQQNFVPLGNGGAAANNMGKAQWTIDAGHGYQPGDGIKINNTGETAYDGVEADGEFPGINHKIIAVTGNVWVHAVDDDTFTLHTSSAAALVGGSTGRVDISSAGTGLMYIKSAGTLRQLFTVDDQTEDTFTCNNHGMTSGLAARLSVGDPDNDELPTGLHEGALITVNTDYTAAGTSGDYFRPKRVKNVTFRDINVVAVAPYENLPTEDGIDSAVMKVNNTDNVLIERMKVNQTGEEDVELVSFAIGSGNRKVTLRDCTFPNGFLQNPLSWVHELTVDNCVLGDGQTIPAFSMLNLQVARLTVRNSKLRFSTAGLSTADVAADFRFADMELWDIQNNQFEGNSTSRTRMFRIATSTHLNESGKLVWLNNSRTNIGAYTGLTVNTAANDTCTATNHSLFTGDRVYFTTSATLDAAITASTYYFARRTGDNTFTIHTSLAGASNNTDRVDIGGAGTGTNAHKLHGEHVGCNIANSNPADRLFMQRDGGGSNFFGVSAPSNSSVIFRTGDVVWNMNPSTTSDTDGEQPQGWYCTKTGVLSSSAGTFRTMMGEAPTLAALQTVADTLSGATGDVIGWSGTEWDDITINLDFLSDVTITTAATKQTIRYNGSGWVNSQLASTDLSDYAATITGTTNDIIGWNGTAWDDLTLTSVITGTYGNGTDGHVLTSDGAGGVAWEAVSGGSGLTVTGTEEGGRIPVYNPGTDDYRSTLDPHGLSVASFGASLRNEQAFADVTDASLVLETGYDSHWPDDANPESNCVGWTGLILGAGPAHAIGAPTGLKAGTLGTTGSTSRSYTIVSRSGGLGHSAKATSVEVTDGVTANSESNYTFLAWRKVAGADGYAIYSEIYSGSPNDAAKWHVADVPGGQTCWEVPCNATTAFVFADIGDKITQTGTGDTGTLVGYINDDGGAGRVWIVPDLIGAAGDAFDGTGVMTVNGRTGTPTGAAANVEACYWEDHGERYYEGRSTNSGDDWSNICAQRSFRRMPTIGMVPLSTSHTALTSDGLTGILRIGRDEAQQLTQDTAAHWIRIYPFTPRDMCDAPAGSDLIVPGKYSSVAFATLDSTVGMSIDPHQIGDTIIEPWSSSGRRYKCRRRNGWFMTGPDTTELQQFVVSGSPTGGDWTVTSSTYGTSTSITFGATAAQFTAAVRTIPGFEECVGYIHSGTTPNYTYRLAFIGVNGDTPQLTVTNSLTGGSSPAVAVSTTTAGVGITMDSTLNNFTQETSGGLQWRREEADVPVNPPPASAMNDAQPFIVTAASGTTLTIDTDLSTPGNQGVETDVNRTPGDLTSMAGLVLHNDLRAFNLAYEMAAANTNGTKTVVIPGGNSELISSHGADWDLDGAEDYLTSGSEYSFFGKGVNWINNGKVWVRPAVIPHGSTNGTADQTGLSLFRSSGAVDFTLEGGEWNVVEIAEPISDHYYGYTDFKFISGTLTGGTQVASRTKLRDVNFWSFPGTYAVSGERSELDKASFENCMWDWGGGGVTAGISSCEQLSIDACKMFGRDGGLEANSSTLYTDTNPPGPSLSVNNTYIYNSRYEIRTRAPHVFFINTFFDECGTLLQESGVYDVKFADCTFKNVDNFTCSKDALGTNCLFWNSPVTFSGGKQLWSNCFMDFTEDASAALNPVTISGGTIQLSNWQSMNNYDAGVRGIAVSGGTNHRITGFGLEQGTNPEAPTISTSAAFKSDLWISDSRFVANGGPQGQIFDSTVARIHLDNVEFLDGGNTVTNYVDIDGVWIDATNCTFRVRLLVGGEATGTAQAGAAGTITLASGAESSVDHSYRGWQIYTTGGTGSGQTRYITGYVASTRVATVDSNWGVNPDSTTTYAMMPPQRFKGNNFMSTTADTFATRGAIFEDNDFNVHPTLSDLAFVKGNTIRGENMYTPAVLASGSQELTQRYVTDFVRLTQHASNSTITGLPEMMGGQEYTFVAVGASGTLTWDHDSGVTEATELLLSTGADFAADAVNKSRTFWRDSTTIKWRDK